MAQDIAASEKTAAISKESPVQYVGEPTSYYTETVPVVSPKLLIQWRTSVLALLERVFDQASATCREFSSHVGGNAYPDTVTQFHYLHAIFLSAKADFDGGYLFDVRKLVHAEVFEDELEEAEYFLAEGYKIPAAVIAGTVLESTLRQCCSDNGISLRDTKGRDKTLDPLNQDLYAASIYTKNSLERDYRLGWHSQRCSSRAS